MKILFFSRTMPINIGPRPVNLLDEGKAYRDFTPKADPNDQSVKEGIVERARAAQGVKNMRDNPYRDLPHDESDRRAAAGEPFAIRSEGADGGQDRI